MLVSRSTLLNWTVVPTGRPSILTKMGSAEALAPGTFKGQVVEGIRAGHKRRSAANAGPTR